MKVCGCDREPVGRIEFIKEFFRILYALNLRGKIRLIENIGLVYPLLPCRAALLKGSWEFVANWNAEHP